MSVDKIWVLAEIADGAPITTSLELITRARSLRQRPGAARTTGF